VFLILITTTTIIIIIIIIKGLRGRGEDSLDLCTMEDEGGTILQNKSKPSSSDAASDPR
jgi:hypothetical protein